VLQSALTRDRLASAYLFVGPPGVGKNLTAMEFVKALNCEGGDGNSCDECAPCRLIESGEFPDLYAPDKQGRRIVKGNSGERGKNTLVNIISRLHYPAVMGRAKVMLLDPADALTPEAGNMLLKTLEEPPRNTHFVLITTLESSVLPTIVSRCQRLRFPPLSAEDVARFLVSQRAIPEDLAQSLAAASEGSIARALDLNAGKVLEQRLEIVDFLLALPKNDVSRRVAASIRTLQVLAGKEREVVERVGTIATMLSRDLLSASSGLAAEVLLFNERASGIQSLARSWGRQGTLTFASLVREFGNGLRHNENPKHLLYFLGNEMAELSSLGASPASRSTHA
jgi:DNA polymerase III subunit delta'